MQTQKARFLSTSHPNDQRSFYGALGSENRKLVVNYGVAPGTQALEAIKGQGHNEKAKRRARIKAISKLGTALHRETLAALAKGASHIGLIATTSSTSTLTR